MSYTQARCAPEAAGARVHKHRDKQHCHMLEDAGMWLETHVLRGRCVFVVHVCCITLLCKWRISTLCPAVPFRSHTGSHRAINQYNRNRACLWRLQRLPHKRQAMGHASNCSSRRRLFWCTAASCTSEAHIEVSMHNSAGVYVCQPHGCSLQQHGQVHLERMGIGLSHGAQLHNHIQQSLREGQGQ